MKRMLLNRALLSFMLFVGLIVAACDGPSERAARAASGAERSVPELMRQYGCPSCHVVPHVPGAVGKVGPSLASLSQRSVIAGSLQNTPQNLRNWIMHPQHFRPGTAMPEMGVTDQDARRIEEFLEQLR